MNTISAEEFKKRYGTQGATKFYQPQQTLLQKAGQQIKGAFKGGLEQAKQGVQQVGQSQGNPLDLVEGVGRVGSGLISAAVSPLAPVVEPTIGAGVKYAADKLSDIPQVQKFAQTGLGKGVERVAENVVNYATIAGTVGGAMKVPKVGTAIKIGTGKMAGKLATQTGKITKSAGKVTENLRGALKDVTPTSERLINHEITQALELTAGDVRNIAKSTGNEVGKFIAEKNLIGENVEATSANLKNYFDQNYAQVRTEVGKVTKTYKRSQVKSYYDALSEVKKQVEGVAGQQKAVVEIENLMNKKDLTLNDVQRAKELVDEHTSLYKATGDVKEGVAKQGLDNLRKDLRKFVEKEVKDNTGADIKELNNNVSTSRSIMDAIKNRETRGLTRQHISLSDVGLFGSGSFLGTPLFGAALVVTKKILQSPSIRLKIAKFIDGLSDAKKAAIAKQMEAGKVPPEIKKAIKP